MSASQVNARIVIPVNSFHNIIKGYKIDYVLYTNNYEEIDDEHKVIEKFQNSKDALKVFQEGMVMSKGTLHTLMKFKIFTLLIYFLFILQMFLNKNHSINPYYKSLFFISILAL